MPDTYGAVWRMVKLHCPAAPTFLVREWVNDAWKQLTRFRPTANYLRVLSAIQIAAARTVADAAFTVLSDTVTSAGGNFDATDEGREIRVGTYPSYTIISFDSANQITLDRPYGEASVTGDASIYDAYATVPDDFQEFDMIIDPYNQRRLAWWITQDQLSIMDPTRTVSDSGPRCLVAASPSPVESSLGRMRFEFWPRPTAARSYTCTYYKKGQGLSETFAFTGAMSDAGDVLQTGALAQAARWPGTNDVPNPYFNLGLGDRLQKEFEAGMQKISLRDDDIQGTDLASVNWSRWPLADIAYNDEALRSSDATVLDYY